MAATPSSNPGTAFSRRILVVVAAADRAAANQAALKFDPTGGRATFSVGLSPTGAGPATHYVVSMAVTLPTLMALQQLQAKAFPEASFWEYDLDGQPDFPDQVFLDLGLQRIQPPLADATAAAAVTPAPPSPDLVLVTDPVAIAPAPLANPAPLVDPATTI